MNTLENMSDFDVFFYYGLGELSLENASDLMLGLLQEKRTLYYNRREGIANKENYPNALTLQVGMKFEIASYAAYRNTQVGDGTDGTKERRLGVSQDSIAFEVKNDNLDVKVFYIEYNNYNDVKNINLPV